MDFQDIQSQASNYKRRMTRLQQQAMPLEQMLNNLTDLKATTQKPPHTFEKLDEINIREQCKALANLEQDLKETKIDKRSRLTIQAIKQIENQILDQFRQEKVIKSFTNEDDTRSKLIYDTISRTNDTAYFMFINGIKEKMTNIDAILQFSRDPYSYMLHKNRRLLIKLLNLQERKQEELQFQKKRGMSLMMGGGGSPTQSPTTGEGGSAKDNLNNKMSRLSLINRDSYDAYFKMKNASIFADGNSKFKNEKDLAKTLQLTGQFTRMNKVQQTFSDHNLVRPKTQTNLRKIVERLQDKHNMHSIADELLLKKSSPRRKKHPLLTVRNRPQTQQSPPAGMNTSTFPRAKTPLNQKSHYAILLLNRQNSIRTPFVEQNKELELYHKIPKRMLTMRSNSNANGTSKRSKNNKSEMLIGDSESNNRLTKDKEHIYSQLSQIRTSCDKLIKKSEQKLQDLERHREATDILDQKQQKYFQLISSTLEEQDPTLIEAYYEFKKREDEFAKSEIKNILQDFKVSSLTFQQQIDMAKWDSRYQKKKNNKQHEAIQRMQQEISYRPIQ